MVRTHTIRQSIAYKVRQIAFRPQKIVGLSPLKRSIHIIHPAFIALTVQ
jgi:hypothetical protein